MRGLALARAWVMGGGRCAFLSRCENPALRARVADAGCAFWAAQSSDGAELEEAKAKAKEGAWLVVDGYHFDAEYLKGARALGFRVLTVDDFGHRASLPADIILNQNLGAERRDYAGEPGTLQLLGTRYALLRPEFLELGRRPREFPKRARRLLVTLGGSDPDNVTMTVVEALAQIKEPVETLVVLGAENRHEDALRAAAAARPEISFARNVDDMPRRMIEADAAVTAGGTTCWEAAYLGLPSLVLVLADNQREVAGELDKAGAAYLLGEGRQAAAEAVARALDSLLGDAERRRALSRAGQALVDGLGARRVAGVLRAAAGGALTEKDVTLRLAAEADAFEIWRLANQPSVRRHSFARDPIALPTHLKWFPGQLKDPRVRFWVLEVGGAVAAQIRYAVVESGTAEVHFSVHQAFRGKGLATQALLRTRQESCRSLGVARLRGVVIEPNEPSARAFLKAGYRRVAELKKSGLDCAVFEAPCS